MKLNSPWQWRGNCNHKPTNQPTNHQPTTNQPPANHQPTTGQPPTNHQPTTLTSSSTSSANFYPLKGWWPMYGKRSVHGDFKTQAFTWRQMIFRCQIESLKSRQLNAVLSRWKDAEWRSDTEAHCRAYHVRAPPRLDFHEPFHSLGMVSTLWRVISMILLASLS